MEKMKLVNLFNFVFFCWWSLTGISCYTFDDVYRLKEDLFKKSNYSTMVRPKLNQSEQTEINIHLFLRQLLELNSREQVMRTMGWFTITWVDEKLRWNPDNYGGIIEMNVLQKEIWIPDLTATNSIDEDAIFGGDNLRVYVNYTGNIDWEPGFTFTTSCIVDVTMFPVDYQTCSVTVAPWMTTNQEIFINETKVVTDNLLVPNGQFDIVDSSATNDFFTLSGNPSNTLTQSNFTLKLKRKATFYLLNVIGPIAAISFLCGVSFLVPSESGEKLTVSITVLLSLTVFLGVIDASLPKTSDSISYFVIYVTSLIGMSFLAVVGNSIIISIHNKNPGATIPNCLKLLLIRKYKKLKSKEEANGKVFPEFLDRNSVISVTNLELSCCGICGKGIAPACNHWPEVAKIVDRVALILFSLVLVAINARFSFLMM
ncbi:hypothetical protein SNE40_008043 [Patella caerulea]|uniref:Uncharacterized protein n=1 Tax=Patella caerulea TaxID=87958 RepID=A0AAN8PUJ9_PATCE